MKSEMLSGRRSKALLSFLLAGDGPFVYQIVTDKKFLRLGYFQEGDKTIAFDNTSGNCNVEEFEFEEDAIKWLNHDYEDLSDFKGKTSVC